MNTDTIIELLTKVPLFVTMPQSVIHKLADLLQTRTLLAGTPLFRKGDLGSSMFIVNSGTLNIVIEDEYGRELILKQSGAGEILGEISLVDQEPRAASAVALEDTELLWLDREDFMQVMNEYPPDFLESIRDVSAYLRFEYTVQTLKSLEIFDGVPEENLIEMASKMDRVTLNTGEVLFKKGDIGNALYLIKSGWVKITTEDASGEELVLNQSGIGEAIGDMSLIDNEPRSATVIALSPVEMLKLEREAFTEVISSQPLMAMHIMRELSHRLRFATTYIEEAIQLSQRVAEGDYSFAMTQLDTLTQSQNQIVGDEGSAEDRANELLTAFFTMIKGVQEREERLKSQLRELTIQIDEAKRQEEYKQLTETPFFAELKAAADKIREDRDAEGDK